MSSHNTLQHPEHTHTVWQHISHGNSAVLESLRAHSGISFRNDPTHAWHSPEVAYFPVSCSTETADAVSRSTIVFALTAERLVTLHTSDGCDPLEQAAGTLSAGEAESRDPKHIMLDLLRELNATSERTVENSMRDLDQMAEETNDAIAGHNAAGEPLGVSDTRLLLARMNRLNEMLSHTQETQFQLARAARYLASLTTDSAELHQHDRFLVAVAAVKEYAGDAQERMNAMHHSITAMLEVKQHEIVKVFTIITAVFLPPTLIATFYGMNFVNMPALETQHGYLITTAITFIAAVIPLWYIKRKGWLR